jgi:hypothetical protein
MKKTIFMLSVAGAFVLVSCKKTSTCDCRATLKDAETVNYKHTIKQSTKKGALTECQNIEYNQDQEFRKNGGSYICNLR